MSFNHYVTFVENTFPQIATIVKSSYLANHDVEDVSLSEALSELSVCNPRVSSFLGEIYFFFSSLNDDTKFY
ncbi:hypothetical protein [Dipodfec virus UA06Rod_20]|uniref:Uncharacterized protein n=1 Tax=Dipodfec virus UA06Rod_20 TaxID=2929320 RepID=A0A976N246_9VIRU|nr:hypothetical protein [Dipodfec virus UA06Rod_20]